MIDLRSLCLIEHILECRVVVVRVRSVDRLGEERRRVQKLVEVMGLGLITCGEGELVSRVHTLFAGVVQVYTTDFMWLRKRKKGRKVEQEVEREDHVEETAHTWMAMEMT